jgi:ABC-type branched-subunit amino acid transport system permease subunit
VRDELEAAYAARQLHFRKRGMQDLLMSVSALILGGAGVSWSYFGLRGSVRMTSGEFKLSILMICLLFVGGFLLIRGIHRILTGGAAEKSASDLSEID